MITAQGRILAILWLVLSLNASAGTLYVDLNSPSPTPPYTNWATAATNIQDAIDAATNGDFVLVTNGVYQAGGRVVPPYLLTNRVVVDKAITVESVGGPAVTIIRGSKDPVTTTGDSAVRCVWLTNNASLIGFTITNGATRASGNDDYEQEQQEQSGGGIWCAGTSTIVSNCVIVGNSANHLGGGTYFGTLTSCALSGNDVVFVSILLPSGSGGGAWGSTVMNCSLVGNIAPTAGGAGGCMMNNCLIASNTGSEFGGGVVMCQLENCTVVGNSSDWAFGGLYMGITPEAINMFTCRNCVVYDNIAPTNANYVTGTYAPIMNYCSTFPLALNGVGNITNAPLFVDPANGDFRLQSNSPCINAGYNPFAPERPDLDGNPRIAGGTVDIGAYEFQNPASIISYAWLQQFNLATDGSADSADSDSDGMNNWQEWRAGTVPTNAASLLLMLSPIASNSNLVVTWQSVTNHSYYLQRAGDPAATFLPLATNIMGQTGTTSFTDTNAPAPGPWYYRVGVQ